MFLTNVTKAFNMEHVYKEGYFVKLENGERVRGGGKMYPTYGRRWVKWT